MKRTVIIGVDQSPKTLIEGESRGGWMEEAMVQIIQYKDARAKNTARARVVG